MKLFWNWNIPPSAARILPPLNTLSVSLTTRVFLTDSTCQLITMWKDELPFQELIEYKLGNRPLFNAHLSPTWCWQSLANCTKSHQPTVCNHLQIAGEIAAPNWTSSINDNMHINSKKSNMTTEQRNDLGLEKTVCFYLARSFYGHPMLNAHIAWIGRL